MKVVKDAAEKTEKAVKLSTVEPGRVFRFAETSFEEALTGTDESAFFMVVNFEPKDATRVFVVSLDGKNSFKRDLDRPVILHDAEIHVKPNL